MNKKKIQQAFNLFHMEIDALESTGDIEQEAVLTLQKLLTKCESTIYESL